MNFEMLYLVFRLALRIEVSVNIKEKLIQVYI